MCIMYRLQITITKPFFKFGEVRHENEISMIKKNTLSLTYFVQYICNPLSQSKYICIVIRCNVAMYCMYAKNIVYFKISYTRK